MKSKYIVFVFILTFQIHAQTYYAEYELIRSINYMEFTAKSELFVDSDKTLFLVHPYQNLLKDGQEINNDSGSGIVMSGGRERCEEPKKYYIDYQNQKRLEYLYENDCRASMWIKENYEPIEWTILNETKTIGDFETIAAEAYVNDRKWVVYFTLEIPINHGPWRLHGLPGLVLEAHSLPDGREDVYVNNDAPELYFFRLVEFKEINESIEIPEIKQFKSFEEYKRSMINDEVNSIKYLRSSVPNMDIDSDIPLTKSLDFIEDRKITKQSND